MKRPTRGLTPQDAALWARVANTVTPLPGNTVPRIAEGGPPQVAKAGRSPALCPAASPRHQPAAAPSPRAEIRPSDRHGLDAGWDRKLARGVVQPDFTLDLHGASLDAAHGRLDHGLTLAMAQGARVLLLITGRPRPSDDYASRGARRGAIRAKVFDWLMAGPHASRIAAVRPAHPRHGGAGAVYLVLRRMR